MAIEITSVCDVRPLASFGNLLDLPAAIYHRKFRFFHLRGTARRFLSSSSISWFAHIASMPDIDARLASGYLTSRPGICRPVRLPRSKTLSGELVAASVAPAIAKAMRLVSGAAVSLRRQYRSTVLTESSLKISSNQSGHRRS
jgi:hypothetical protein